jgi:hypothetical protein
MISELPESIPHKRALYSKDIFSVPEGVVVGVVVTVGVDVVPLVALTLTVGV